MNSTVKSSKKSWPFFILGLALLAAMPLTLYLTFGNREIVTVSPWALIILGFGLSLLGYVFLVIGVIRSRKVMGTIERVSDNHLTRGIVQIDKRRTMSWKVWSVMTVIDLLLVLTSWRDVYGYSLTDVGRYVAAGLILLYPIMFYLSWKIWRKNLPWYVALIDPRFVPRDEREQGIIQQAALTTLGVMTVVVVIILVAILIFPPTSAMAIAWLYIAALGIMRTIFGYVATKKGISDEGD